jgi:hypothetical protein
VGLTHNSLSNYYTTVFALAQHHKYSLNEIEDLMPYERDLYVDMLLIHLEKEKEELKKGR